MQSALKIANLLIEILENQGVYSITPLKLQKLLYYSQAWNLVFSGRPLFSEKIEAWVHGPVIPRVYQFYKKFGGGSIKNTKEFAVLSKREKEVLEMVCQVYGDCSPYYLEELTHSELPWIKARRGLRPLARSNREVSMSDMKNYYTSFAKGMNPPRIDADVISKNKRVQHHKKKKNNFLAGMESVMDIMPVNKRFSGYGVEDFSGFDSDLEAMSSDWDRVGSDILDVLDDIRKADLKNE
ncbi:MAG: type II toxin-antitoxin system antitoxin SocA domain-containing protein [Cyanobacteria bacterium J06639_14]